MRSCFCGLHCHLLPITVRSSLILFHKIWLPYYYYYFLRIKIVRMMACWAWARQLFPDFWVILTLSFLYPICRAGTIPSGLQGCGEDAQRSCPEVPKESACPHDGLPPMRQWTEGPPKVALETMECLTGCNRLKIKNKAKI